MRLATLRTPTGPHAAVQVGDSYVDLVATDPTLTSSIRQIVAGNLFSRVKEVAAHRLRSRCLLPVPSCMCRFPTRKKSSASG